MHVNAAMRRLTHAWLTSLRMWATARRLASCTERVPGVLDGAGWWSDSQCVQDGRTSLMSASHSGHMEVVKYLCEVGGEELLMRARNVSGRMRAYWHVCLHACSDAGMLSYTHVARHSLRCVDMYAGWDAPKTCYLCRRLWLSRRSFMSKIRSMSFAHAYMHMRAHLPIIVFMTFLYARKEHICGSMRTAYMQWM